MSLVQWWKVEQTEPCTTPLTPCSLALQAGCFRNPRNKSLLFVSWVPCWSSYVFQMFSVRSCLLVAIQIWTWCQREREGLICFLSVHWAPSLSTYIDGSIFFASNLGSGAVAESAVLGTSGPRFWGTEQLFGWKCIGREFVEKVISCHTAATPMLICQVDRAPEFQKTALPLLSLPAPPLLPLLPAVEVGFSQELRHELIGHDVAWWSVKLYCTARTFKMPCGGKALRILSDLVYIECPTL